MVVMVFSLGVGTAWTGRVIVLTVVCDAVAMQRVVTDVSDVAVSNGRAGDERGDAGAGDGEVLNARWYAYMSCTPANVNITKEVTRKIHSLTTTCESPHAIMKNSKLHYYYFTTKHSISYSSYEIHAISPIQSM